MKKQLLIIALLCAGVSTMEATNLTTNSGDDHALANLKVSDVSAFAKAAARKYTALYAQTKQVAVRNLGSDSTDSKPIAQNTLKALNDFVGTREGSDLVKQQVKCTPEIFNVASDRLMNEHPVSMHEALAAQ